MQPTVLAKDQRVGGTNQGGTVGHDIGKLQHSFLVGNRDIYTNKTKTRQNVQNFLEILGCDIHWDIVTLDAMAAQPEAVKRRGSAVRNRMADHAGKRNSRKFSHAAMQPLLPR